MHDLQEKVYIVAESLGTHDEADSFSDTSNMMNGSLLVVLVRGLITLVNTLLQKEPRENPNHRMRTRLPRPNAAGSMTATAKVPMAGPHLWHLDDAKRTCLGILLNNNFDDLDVPEFFRRTVPRECINDDCILYTILAMGATYRSLYHDTNPQCRLSCGSFQHDALEYYTKALSMTSCDLIPGAAKVSARTVLIRTVCFVMLELMQGNVMAATRLSSLAAQSLRDNLKRCQVAASLDDQGVLNACVMIARTAALRTLKRPAFLFPDIGRRATWFWADI